MMLSLICMWLVLVAKSENLQECNESGNYFLDKVTPEYSTKWSMEYFDTYKVYTNKDQNMTYKLYACGTTSEAESKYDGVLAVPFEKVAVTQTPFIPHLEMLGIPIDAYIGNPSYISSPCLLQTIQNNQTLVIFDETDPYYTDAEQVDEYLQANPNAVVIASSYDIPANTMFRDRYLILSEQVEEQNKDIFDWHKVYGALYNLEQLANQQVTALQQRYDCVSNNANFITSEKQQPVVLWAYYYDYNNITGWDVADCTTKDNYYCEYARDCSSILLQSTNGTAGNDESGPLMTDEEFYNFSGNAQYWIYPAFNWDDAYSKKKNYLDTFFAVQSQQVYDVQGSGDNAWFESRYIEYDVLLQDFCQVVGTTDSSVNLHTRKWLRNVLIPEPIGTLGTCSPGPLQSRASECTDLELYYNNGQTTSSATTIRTKAIFTMIISLGFIL